MEQKILVLGATGAMGQYLVPELLKMGYRVDAVALEKQTSRDKKLNCIQADAFEEGFLKNTMQNGKYDAVVDFLIYRDADEYAKKYMEVFLENTKQYIFLSSYRVYAGDFPITEQSLRLLDAQLPDDFVKPFEYAIYKAQAENHLRAGSHKNWTIVRPAITYSKGRYQLVTLEANVAVRRALQGKTVLLPEAAMEHQATMSWAGDVAKMIARLVLNPQAYCETFTVSTSEHHTWREVAEIYREIVGLKYEVIPTEDFLSIWAYDSVYRRQQLFYDRCFDRIVDNGKILKVTGLRQSDLMPLAQGLKLELAHASLENLPDDPDVNRRMDEYITAKNA